MLPHNPLMTPEMPDSADRSESAYERAGEMQEGAESPASSSASAQGVSAADAIGYAVATVARRLGVAPATLRTWARRYGLGASITTVGAHRRYTEADVLILERVQQLVTRGIPLAAAAASALSEGGAQPSGEAGARDLGGATTDAGREHKATPGGGVIIALADGTPAARGLARAATALDSSECARIMTAHIAQRGVVAAWDELIRPVLSGVGEKWQRTGLGVEVEHVLSHAVVAVLARCGQDLTHPVNRRPVILACIAEEQHSLPLYAIYAALAERRIAARVLGARVPGDSLGRAIERTGPAAVIVWSQLASTADADYLANLPNTRPAVTVVAAGPGWNGVDVGAAPRVTDLSEAVVAVEAALRL